MPRGRRVEIPSTIERSSEHAQEIWKKTHDSAIETYGEGEAAHRVAYAALKHQYEKKGDRWVKKARKGRPTHRRPVARTPGPGRRINRPRRQRAARLREQPERRERRPARQNASIREAGGAVRKTAA